MQRVFIGIPVDGPSQLLINDLLKPIKNSRQDIRWVPEINRHLTLAFLGNRPVSEVDHLLPLLDEAYQREVYFQYRLTALERFPDLTGRIIALTDKPTGALDSLYQITRKLLRSSKIQFIRKELRPHITLGRIRKAKHVKTTFDQQTSINLKVTKVILYQSTITESGSIYSPLKTTQLSSQGFLNEEEGEK